MKCSQQIRHQGSYYGCGYSAVEGSDKCDIHAPQKRTRKPRTWTRKSIRQQRNRVFGQGAMASPITAVITSTNHLQFHRHDVPAKRIRVIDINPDTLEYSRRNWPDYMKKNF